MHDVPDLSAVVGEFSRPCRTPRTIPATPITTLAYHATCVGVSGRRTKNPARGLGSGSARHAASFSRHASIPRTTRAAAKAGRCRLELGAQVHAALERLQPLVDVELTRDDVHSRRHERGRASGARLSHR